MGTLYEKIEFLCTSNGMNITSMCKEAGVSRGSITDLKVGRNKTLKPDTLDKIADYFDTSVDYLLGRTDDPENSDRFGPEDPADHSLDVYREQQKTPTLSDEREIGLNDFTYALNGEVSELTESDKQLLLSMARQLNEARKHRDGTKAD